MSADGADPTKPELRPRGAMPNPAPEPPPVPQKANNRRRWLLMAAVPVVIVLIGGYFWLTGGRYVSTDDAYVQQARVTITSKVSGQIVDVAVHENQLVKAGDVLFRIDPQPYEIALHQAEAAVAAARLNVEQLRSAYRQATTQLKIAKDTLNFQQSTFQRQKDLLAKGVTSQAAYDAAENNLRSAEQAVAQADQQVASATAALSGNPDIATDDHPAVLQALAALDQAKLNLAETEVKAPADGVVAQTDKLNVGQYVTNPSGNPTALLSLVKTGDTWVEANYKETDLTKMHAGQTAEVEVDAYPGHKLQGVIDSIGAGTGAEFSLLPAQNATGNWVKVVQRVPVRVHLDQPPADLALRTGLSVSVTVDTESSAGTAMAATD